ncbi:MAG: polyamine aminopropyltransferase [Neisseriaceae bacterium]|nr:polyamine aminopropyltransferase [Neisseriaceae bacterium]
MKRKLFKKNQAPIFPDATVSEENGVLALHLATDTIQSAMNIDNPAELVLAYSRAMVAFCLFNDTPQHITHIGLGGGSIARWINAHFPESHQMAVEINPAVIHIARMMFELPLEDEFFQIVEADGVEIIAAMENSTDIILVDAFDGVQIIDEMLEMPFLKNCRKALKKYGIFVINLWSADRRYNRFVEQIKNAFDGKILEIPAETHGNVAVLGFNRLPENISDEKLKKQAEKLSKTTNLNFTHNFSAIKSDNQKRRLW